MSLAINKRIFYPLFLLLIPFLGSIFSDQVNWSLFDFLVMGILLLLLGIGVNRVSQKGKNKKLRIITILIIVIVFLILWAELAVGVFDSPFAGS